MTKILKIAFVSLFIAALIVYALKKVGWDNLFPRSIPQVLTENKPLAPKVAPPKEVMNLQDSFARVAEAVRPAVVNISAVHISKSDMDQFFFGDPHEFFRRFFGDEPREKKKPRSREFRTEGTGSGVIIDPEGYILTNNHVIQGAEQLTVHLESGDTFRGKVVGTDPRTDLAVIRIKAANPFPFVALGDSANIRIGDWVLAIGSPFGLEQTVTAGIISAIRQSLNIEGRWFRGLLQTDAAINRGNSGGPLVNLKGEVVGINAAIFAPTGVFAGIGFAIPVNRAKLILKDLIEKGYVERSWMGVEIAPVDDVIADQFGLEKKSGALVNNVIPDSPSDKAGILRGDIILEFDGKKIKGVTELQDYVAQTSPGKNVKVKVNRGGSRKTLKLTTAVMPSQMALNDKTLDREDNKGPKQTSWLGAEFSDLTDSVRRAYSISEDVEKGIVVSGLPAKSLAAEAGLQEGDVIRSVNRKKISRVADLEKLKDSFSSTQGLIFDVLRRGRWFYLTFKKLQ